MSIPIGDCFIGEQETITNQCPLDAHKDAMADSKLVIYYLYYGYQGCATC